MTLVAGHANVRRTMELNFDAPVRMIEALLPLLRASAPSAIVNGAHALEVSTPEVAAEAVIDAGLRGRAERYVPRPYALAAVARILAPRLVRRVLSGGVASVLITRTAADERA